MATRALAADRGGPAPPAPSTRCVLHPELYENDMSIPIEEIVAITHKRERVVTRRHPKQLDEAAVLVLHKWMFSRDHFDFPYPTDQEKEALAAETGLSVRQLNHWFTNARKRMWAPLRRKRGLPIPEPGDRMRAQVIRRDDSTPDSSDAGSADGSHGGSAAVRRTPPSRATSPRSHAAYAGYATPPTYGSAPPPLPASFAFGHAAFPFPASVATPPTTFHGGAMGGFFSPQPYFHPASFGAYPVATHPLPTSASHSSLGATSDGGAAGAPAPRSIGSGWEADARGEELQLAATTTPFERPASDSASTADRSSVGGAAAVGGGDSHGVSGGSGGGRTKRAREDDTEQAVKDGEDGRFVRARAELLLDATSPTGGAHFSGAPATPVTPAAASVATGVHSVGSAALTPAFATSTSGVSPTATAVATATATATTAATASTRASSAAIAAATADADADADAVKLLAGLRSPVRWDQSSLAGLSGPMHPTAAPTTTMAPATPPMMTTPQHASAPAWDARALAYFHAQAQAQAQEQAWMRARIHAAPSTFGHPSFGAHPVQAPLAPSGPFGPAYHAAPAPGAGAVGFAPKDFAFGSGSVGPMGFVGAGAHVSPYDYAFGPTPQGFSMTPAGGGGGGGGGGGMYGGAWGFGSP